MYASLICYFINTCSQLRGKHVPCILRKRKVINWYTATLVYTHLIQSSEFDTPSPSVPTDDRRALEEISTSHLTFSPSMLLNSPLVRHQHGSGKKRRRRQKSSENSSSYLAPYIASTPIRDIKSATTFSPLTKSHDIPYDSYKDSGYITGVCLQGYIWLFLFLYTFRLSLVLQSW